MKFCYLKEEYYSIRYRYFSAEKFLLLGSTASASPPGTTLFFAYFFSSIFFES